MMLRMFGTIILLLLLIVVVVVVVVVVICESHNGSMQADCQ